MNRFIIAALMIAATADAASAYSPAGNNIMTTWGEAIDPSAVWQEYPRPIMARGEWQNLNGLWNYAITGADAAAPADYQGEILVPFCAESALSGVGKEVGADNALWYKRNFTIPKSWRGRNIMLNFGAVDWQADVWVNGAKVGSHTGGYTPFSLNITPALKNGGDNEVVVRVWDPTDLGPQPRGKQVAKPEKIWYTSVTGIWQTVWLEPVNETHISNLKILPDIDRNTLRVDVQPSDSAKGYMTEVTVTDNGKTVATGRAVAGQPVVIPMPGDVKLWTPDNPHLYDLEVKLTLEGKTFDTVDSYAAMRKFSTKMGDKGMVRLQLNNEDLFHFGLLDQGWWPDGLYTAPTDEALVYDIEKTREWGFNMIRKHIKVEPARWYWHCDRLGMIVWQDMPSGDQADRKPQWQDNNYFTGEEKQRTAISEACYRKEWREIIDALRGFASIGVWVPFNEAWGQFKTVEIAEWTKAYDPTRLVNPASGGNHYQTGDMLDLHNYPDPSLYLYDASRATVLGEYGGIGLVMKEHLWEPDRNWGYVSFSTPEQVTDEYEKYAAKLGELIGRGFSAAVYTQTTDVEIEVNGLMTYDRKAVKVDEARIRKINEKICNSLNEKK